MKRLKIIFCVLLTAYLSFYIFTNANSAVISVKNAVYVCLDSIIPSLFAFMVITDFLQKSGIYKYFTKPVSMLLSKIFKIDENIFSLFILSQIGGFPVGASIIKSLTENNTISKVNAKYLLAPFFCSGPTFIICAVALRIYQSAKIGIYIYFSIFISNLLLLIIICKVKKIHFNFSPRIDIKAETFITSVSNAAKAIAKVCSMIVLFSLIISSISIVKIDFIKPLLEISKIGEIKVSPFICAGLISFGGICVLMQILAICENKISLSFLIITRPIVFITTSSILYLFIKFLLKNICPVYNNIFLFTKSENANIIPSILLIIMVSIITLQLNRQNAQ